MSGYAVGCIAFSASFLTLATVRLLVNGDDGDAGFVALLASAAWGAVAGLAYAGLAGAL